MKTNSILVTGGAGYIGSHVVKALLDEGYTNITVLDNLSTGFAHVLPDNVNFILGDIQDKPLIEKLFVSNKFDTVMHFAACTVIPESIEQPLKYYDNNTIGTANVIHAACLVGTRHFIFSSTAAVYGMVSDNNVTEDNLLNPTHPYGRSKWMAEEILKDTAPIHGLRYAILRYFNVAGAHPSSHLGQNTVNASHLVKVAVETACQKREFLPVFGTDYATPDGTCIRDYIHVCDLADAHLRALDYLYQEEKSCILNCGYGKGFSVKEVIAAVEEVSQKTLPTQNAPRRQGDLPRVVADNARLIQLLHWKPRFDDIMMIVKTAYEYEKNQTLV